MAAKTSAYKGNTSITGERYVHSYIPEEVIEFHKCFNDPDYFIRKYVKIVTLDNGIQPFELYDFQGNMIEKAHNNRFSVFLTARQMGKTTTIGGYLLHAGLFNSNYVIGILANKGSQSKEVLSRIKEMYERLPKFLQQGVAEWNKYSVILGNGTEIFAAATSSSSIRGKSVNILYLDEFGFVPNADEFWTSTYPVITGGKTTKVIITSTPNGLNLFHKIFSGAVKGRNGFVYLEVLWHHHPDRDERWKEETISKIGAQKFAQEYECKFIGSGGTLIDGETIARLVADIPVYETDDGFMRVYKAPEAAKRYVVIADSAEGTGNDESAITIIDVGVKPMKVVLTYANNKIKPIDFAQLIHTLGRRYNDAYLLVESNSIGNLVCNELWNKFENEGLLTTDDKGNIIFSGVKYGIRTTSKTKRTGAQLVKMLVESGDIDVSDERIIEQMQTFVRVGVTNSYAGAPGKKDDLMMTLLIFAWFSGTDFFKDDSGIDVIDDLTDIDPDDEDFIPAVYCNF